MRDEGIKFRVWDREFRVMKYSFFPILHGEANVLDFSFIENWRGGHEAMQYTGLKDKNGKEIYEGDIIATGPEDFYRRVIVEWCPIIGAWVDGNREESGLYFGTDINGKRKQPSPFNDEGLVSRFLVIADKKGSIYPCVIGNIYENPGLVKP